MSMAMRLRLDGLPTELLVGVCQYVAPSDLLAIRQVNRTICIGVEDLFLDAFFTWRTHLITLHGIQVLADISRQSRLVNHIQGITLVALQLNNAARENRGSTRKIWTEQNNVLQRDGRQASLLGDFISAVAAGPHRHNFGITLTERFTGHEYGTASLSRLLGLPKLLVDSGGIDSLVRDLIRVLLAVGDLRPTALRILPDDILRADAFDLAHSDASHPQTGTQKDLTLANSRPGKSSLLKDIQYLFGNLTTLQLNFGPVYYEVNSSDMALAFGRGLSQLLKTTTSLQVLIVSGFGGYTSSRTHDGRLIRLLADHIPPGSPLAQLELSWFDACNEDLHELLNRRGQTLGRLHLREITLAKNEGWDNILSLLAQQSEIESLALDCLRSDNEEFDNIPERLGQLTLGVAEYGNEDSSFPIATAKVQQEFNFEGHELVVEGLQMLIERGEYWEYP